MIDQWVWVVINEGSEECGISDEPVGIFRTEAEAEEAAGALNANAGPRRQACTWARVYRMQLPDLGQSA